MDAILLPLKRKISWKVFFIVLALVLVSGLLKAPMIITNEFADQPELWMNIILSITLSNIILHGLLGSIGLLLAFRVGLGLPFVEGWIANSPLQGRFGKVALTALVTAIVLTGVGLGVRYLTAPMIQTAFEAQNIPISALGKTGQVPWWALLSGALSAGIGEEIGFRLGLLTILVGIVGWFWHDDTGRIKPVGFWLANLVVAALFGVFHLTNLSAAGLPLMTGLIIRAIFGNGLLALIFGWLYQRYGLESAMLTHFLLDVFLYVLLPLAV